MQGDELLVHEEKTAVKNRLKRLVSLSGRDAELPVTDSFLLEMADDETLNLRGCRGIADCTAEQIAVRTDRFLLTIRGRGLYFKCYSDTDAMIAGHIDCVVFGR